jgi:DNA-binding XRE family transcriptional regulator
MNQGSKYYALYHFLRQIGEHEVSLTFTKLEQLLDGPLAPTARTQRAWWSNRRTGSAQANAWIDAGYHVAEVDLTAERVIFRKPIPIYQVKRHGDALLWDSELIKLLRRHMNFSQVELADELGVRQQTISEWETGMYQPKRAMSKLLTFVAERAGFIYGEDPPEPRTKQ